MILTKLILYGYGKFYDKELCIPSSSLQVIYGKNEAGKSTIMSFIMGVLFGYPTRRHTALRYEPKKGGQYGGAISIEIDGQLIKIERKDGKSSGEVKVFYPNGTIGGEKELQQLLMGLNRSLFESIYWFDLKGLEGVADLGIEQVGKILFASGYARSHAMHIAERALELKSADLYKQYGKKPVINQKLQQLEHNLDRLNELKQTIPQYEALTQKADHLRVQQRELRLKKEETKMLIQKNQLSALLKPLVYDLKAIDYQVSQLPGTQPFPEEGLNHLDRFQAELIPLENRLIALKSKANNLKDELKSLGEPKEVLAHINEINNCMEKKQYYDIYVRESEGVKQQIRNIKHELESKLEQIGMSQDQVTSIKTDLFIKDKITNLVENEKLVNQEKYLLDHRYEETKKRLEDIEYEIGQLQNKVLPLQDRLNMESIINTSKSQDQSQKREFIQKSIDKIKHRIVNLQEEQKVKSRSFISTSFVLFLPIIALFIWAYSNKNWLIGIFIFLVFITGVYISWINVKRSYLKNKNLLQVDQEELEEELIQFDKENIKSRDKDNVENLVTKLRQDTEINNELEHKLKSKKELEGEFEETVGKFERWERKKYQLAETHHRLCEETGISKRIPLSQLLEVYELIINLKEKIKKYEQMNDDWLQKTQRLNEFTDQVTQLVSKLTKQKIDKDGISKHLYEINNLLKTEQKIQEKRLLLADKVRELEKDMELEEEKRHILNQQITNLYDNAQVRDEESFRCKGLACVEKSKFCKEQERIKSQIYAITSDDQLLNKIRNSTINYQDEINLGQQRLLNIEKDEMEFDQLLADIKSEMNKLESDQVYSDQLYKFHVEKSELEEEVKSWAVYQVALDLLQQTKAHYRNVRLPKVITIAEEYFSYLTEKRYKQILIPEEEETLLVERSDGQRFSANEISRATQELLYFSLRLALAKSEQSTIHAPLIIDDSFVNLDKERMKKTIDLLKEIAKGRQVLFFTCHLHPEFKKDSSVNVLSLETLIP